MPLNIKNFLNRYLSDDLLYLALILIVASILISPMYLSGIPNGRDFPQHLQFAETFYNSISEGDFFPGWAGSDNYGFGSVGIRFYPPMAYYVLAFTRFLTGNWQNAILLAFAFWMFAGSAGVYFWAKERLSSAEAFIAASLYAVAPYHLSQIYQTWLYAEFAAAGVLPFCFLFAAKLCRRRKAVDIVLLTVSYSLLLLTHIPTTITATIALAIYTLFLIDWRHYKETFIKLIAVLVLSLSATAFHWLKIVTEIDWVKHSDARYSTGYYDFHQYLFPMYYSAGDKYWARLLWHFDVSTVLTFLLLLPLIAVLILLLKNNKRAESIDRFVPALVAAGVFTLFIMSVLSVALWESVPLLQKVQFPWRWLSVFSGISVMAFSLSLRYLVERYAKLKKIGLYAVLFLIAAILIFDFTQNIIQSEPLTDKQFNEKLAESRTEAGCPCWWTSWADGSAFKEKRKVSGRQREVAVLNWQNEAREFDVAAGESAPLRIATFYYPHWRALVNDRFAPVLKNEDGSISILVPDKKSSVKLYFDEPRFLRIALILSLTTWCLLLLAGIVMAFAKDAFAPENESKMASIE